MSDENQIPKNIIDMFVLKASCDTHGLPITLVMTRTMLLAAEAIGDAYWAGVNHGRAQLGSGADSKAELNLTI